MCGDVRSLVHGWHTYSRVFCMQKDLMQFSDASVDRKWKWEYPREQATTYSLLLDPGNGSLSGRKSWFWHVSLTFIVIDWKGKLKKDVVHIDKIKAEKMSGFEYDMQRPCKVKMKSQFWELPSCWYFCWQSWLPLINDKSIIDQSPLLCTVLAFLKPTKMCIKVGLDTNYKM